MDFDFDFILIVIDFEIQIAVGITLNIVGYYSLIFIYNLLSIL
jgi:hypothetical protein